MNLCLTPVSPQLHSGYMARRPIFQVGGCSTSPVHWVIDGRLQPRKRQQVCGFEGLIRQFLDTPQRITGRDPLLDRDVGELRAAALPVSSHQKLISWPILYRASFFVYYTPKYVTIICGSQNQVLCRPCSGLVK